MIRLKNSEQINGIRYSCKKLAEVFELISEKVKEGISTFDLNKIAEEEIAKTGGVPSFSNFGGFPTAMCTSVNDVVIHGLPDKKPLISGDIVKLDLGIALDGYFSDSARSFLIGDVSEEVRKLSERTEKALYIAIAQAVYGNRIKDISKAVTEYISPFNYGIVHTYCGHGVGLAVHEEPQVPNNYPYRGSNPRIREGLVIAIEPMITLGTSEVINKSDEWNVATEDGSFTSHWEHTIAVFKDKTEILTRL